MEPQMSPEEFRQLWESLLVRASDKFEVPPEVVRIGDSVICTLGNFSASTGKGKSKKTFNVSAIVAAALTNGRVLNYQASFPEGKRRILYFDTEQSADYCLKIVRRINRLCGYPETMDQDRIKFAHLREKGTLMRRWIIEQALAIEPEVGLVIIDGLRDLLYDINSSAEAAEVIGLLMRWSSQYNLHIHTVLHLNKADDNVRGHIGTELNHKAETILQITKNDADGNISEVKASLVRDREFRPFAFSINEEGLPVLAEGYEPAPLPPRVTFDYQSMTEEMHRAALDIAFNGISDPIGYNELLHQLMVGYSSSLGFSRSRTIIAKLKQFLIKNDILRKVPGRKYVYNRDFHYVQPEKPEETV